MLWLFSQLMWIPSERQMLGYSCYIWWKLHHLVITKIRDRILLLYDSKSHISWVGKTMYKAEQHSLLLHRWMSPPLQPTQTPEVKRACPRCPSLICLPTDEGICHTDIENPFPSFLTSWKASSNCLCNRNNTFFPPAACVVSMTFLSPKIPNQQASS